MKASKYGQKSGLVLVLLFSLTLLAACGATPPPEQVNNDFTVPTYSGATPFTTLQNDPNFMSKVLVQDPNTGPSDVKVFATSASLTDVKNYYTDQMTKLGWNNRSSAIIDAAALGNDGWVLGFEKATNASPAVTHVAGLYMFTPTSQALKDFKGTLPPNNQNVLMVLTGSSAK